MNPGALFVLGLIAVIAVAGISFYLRQKRRDELAAVAKRLGLTYSIEDTANCLALPFALFDKGDGRGTENLLVGTWSGLAVRGFDYWYYDESTDANGNRSRSYSRFSCAVTSVDAALGALSIARENVLTRLADSVGLDDVQFELEDFNRAFNVKSRDPRFANALVDQRMMRWLMTSPRDVAFETSGPWVLVWCHRVPPAEIPGLFETLKGFRDQIPRVVFDLYRGGPA
jgi:hypothetical protein